MTKYIPHKPTPKQAAFMILPHKEALYGGSAGSGKAQSLTTKVVTSNGLKTMNDIHIGDKVFDENGNLCNVIDESEIFLDHKCYELEFDTGEKIIADAGHRWVTFDYKERLKLLRSNEEWKAKRRAKRAIERSKKPDYIPMPNRSNCFASKPVTGTVRTTEEIAETIVVRGDRTNHSIPIAGALKFPEIKLPVPPYTLGAWLGDGTSNGGAITQDQSDHFVLDRIRQDGFVVTDHKNPQSFGIINLIGLLKEAGVHKNKHIPAIYFRASYEQRLELVRGLMDTDGTCDENGSAELSLSDETLAQDAFDMICTLGVKCSMNKGKSFLNGENKKDRYRICITTNLRLFNLPRKAERQNVEVRPTQNMRYIVSCKEVPSVPVKCISVDSPTHQFLVTKSCIPTHNSDCILMSALQYVDMPNYHALILRKSYADLSLPGAIMEKAREWLAGTDAVWHDKTKMFRFPSGSTLTFGYLQYDADKTRYQGANFNFVAFDELTQFRESSYRYLFSRIRKETGNGIPSRMRAATNPGGIGGTWVKNRFLVEKNPNRCFIQASLKDNPYLDYNDYVDSLSELSAVEKAQLLDGNWDIQPEGLFYPDLHKPYPAGCVVEPFPENIRGQRFGGIDWGFTGPACFLCATLDDDDILWIWYERYMRDMTIQEHMNHIPNDPDIVWFADPSQPELIQQMRHRDFLVRRAPNSKQSGIGLVAHRVRKRTLRVSPVCKAIIQESTMYRRRDDRDGIPLDAVNDPDRVTEEPIKRHDHSMDALKYLVAGIAKMFGYSPPSVDEVLAAAAEAATVPVIKEKWKLSEGPYTKESVEVSQDEIDAWHRYDNDAFWNKLD